MPLEVMEHFNIRASNMEATKDFYCDVLGMRVGERPPFDFPGYWIYLGETACVHLIAADSNPAMESYVGAKEGNLEGSGAIDHVAFRGSDVRAFVARAKAHDKEMIHRKIPEFGIHQIFIKDPDGIKIELNFRGEDAKDFDPNT
tara:strand:- start:189 stop:620 length:432 start_codon:yes stop_codon:yes gene_type:complete